MKKNDAFFKKKMKKNEKKWQNMKINDAFLQEKNEKKWQNVKKMTLYWEKNEKKWKLAAILEKLPTSFIFSLRFFPNFDNSFGYCIRGLSNEEQDLF